MPTISAAPLAGLLSRTTETYDDLGFVDTVTASRALQPFVIAHLARRRPLLVVTPTLRDAEAMVDDLQGFVGQNAAAVFPSWETLPHERLSPQPATVGQRLAVLDRLRRLREGNDTEPLRVVVAPVRAVLQPMDPRLADRAPLTLKTSTTIQLAALNAELVTLGYVRVSMVTERGEFAVRGGIVDVFPTTADHPVRIDFWGDTVDSVRSFAVADQRSLDKLDSVTLHAAREVILDEETIGTIRTAAKTMPALHNDLQQLLDGVVIDGIEGLMTALIPDVAYLPTLFGDDAGLVLTDPRAARDRAATLIAQAEELAVSDWIGITTTDGPGLVEEAHQVGFAELDDVIGEHVRRSGTKTWEITPFHGDADLTLRGRPWDAFNGDIVSAAQTVRRYLRDGINDEPVTVILTTVGHGPAQRIAEVLRSEGVAVDVHDETWTVPTQTDGRAHVVTCPLRTGFLSEELGICLLGEFDLFGARRRRTKRPISTRRIAEQTVIDLEPGDIVVHSTHGVGVFQGMITRELPGTSTLSGGNVGTVTRDYVIVEYHGEDRLFVPSDQIDSLTRYVGGEDPKIMRMGGAEWERAKTKAKESVQEMAAELIRLYQARMHSPGHAFSADTSWQGELENAFAYVETPDQLDAINAVKADMESPVPMDRLVLGDVGFGKTEVAVRAAAKCVFDGKQAAVLVPTTLLAQQHGETFAERFSGFPVKIGVLSRFSTPAEQRRTLDGIATGTVDIVIGTHRLLSGDVEFKDLGLLIVDEEQRFGVKHKERVKQLKTSVDVLTMSATPIPRTMEMAITGIRDMTTIDTAPEDRYPVVTRVGPFDEDAAVLAIRRELLREGQVFWLHNSVKTIHGVAARLAELIPSAKIRVGHGQMSENELEQVMLDFWNREFDVLVSTTIIESGIDIPAANTLIVENAERFGLAQLYQLRGRVGRSTTRGYAYLFHHPDKEMTEAAYKRLESISTHTKLGSGMSIALKDLEIRGAGSVLGAEQSGQVNAVGFQTYGQLMGEAVAELTSTGPVRQENEVTVELPIDAHLPATYIEDEGLRLEAYRTVAGVRDARGVKEAKAELIDRYGPLPPPAERLISVAALKAALRRWDVQEVATTPRRTIRVTPVALDDSKQVRLQRAHRDAAYNPQSKTLEIPFPEGNIDMVGHVAATLKAIIT